MFLELYEAFKVYFNELTYITRFMLLMSAVCWFYFIVGRVGVTIARGVHQNITRDD